MNNLNIIGKQHKEERRSYREHHIGRFRNGSCFRSRMREIFLTAYIISRKRSEERTLSCIAANESSLIACVNILLKIFECVD